MYLCYRQKRSSVSQRGPMKNQMTGQREVRESPPQHRPPGSEPFATPRRFVGDAAPFQAARGSMREQESP